MLGIPENYRIDKPLALKTFLPAGLTAPERKRLAATVEGVVLRDQIAGEDIPSRVDGDWNCQVIQTFTVRLKTMTGVGTTAGILQQLVKSLCVLELTDGKIVRYSFALKRLNRNVPGEVVVEDAHLTPARPADASPDAALDGGLDFGAVRNRSDKLAAYREWSTRAFAGARSGLFSGTERVLAAAGWYREGFAGAVFAAYAALDGLTAGKGRAKLLKEQARINGEMRRRMDELERLATTTESDPT